MKQKSARKKPNFLVVMGIAAGLSLPGSSSFATGGIYKKVSLHKPVNAADRESGKRNRIRSKVRGYHNNASVKIYPDADKKSMHVIAKKNEGRSIDFFVFDLEGTLLHNRRMKPKEHHRLTGLTKGMYVYRVFCGDEETASGEFAIH
jgi:hypothetical protein